VSLYLCIFSGNVEVAGVDVGAYSDFGEFRDRVAQGAEHGAWGSLFPVLMNQPDDEGDWAVEDLVALDAELAALAHRRDLDQFRDSEERPLVGSLLALCDAALRVGEPILFQ
jgi:hypothetical protein